MCLADLKLSDNLPYETHSKSQRILYRVLNRIQGAGLRIHDNSQIHFFGDESAQLQAEIYVHKASVFRRILFGGSMAAAESYLEGEWSSPDLTKTLLVFAANVKTLDEIETGFNFLFRPIQKIRHFARRNTKAQAKRNIMDHYDLGNDFYRAFLDQHMLYSSAIYKQEDMTLEDAQLAKLERLCQELQLKSSDHLLEIGTGWGAMAEYAAKHYGCKVTTTTISPSQYEYARARIEAAGLSDKVTLLLSDYRDLQGQYDKVVAIEMIEAVGKKFLPVFFRSCQNLLKPGGRLVLQAITMQDQRYKAYSNSVDFIQRYIFPGGFLPSITSMSEIMTKHTDFVIADIYDMGLDYARTLKEWRQRFVNQWENIIHLGFDERFRRLWLFYLCYCEAGFIGKTTSVVHLSAERR